MPQRRSSGSCCNWMTLPFSDSFEFDCRSWTGIRTVTSSAYPSNRLVHPVDGAPTRGASVSFSNLPTIPNTPCTRVTTGGHRVRWRARINVRSGAK